MSKDIDFHDIVLKTDANSDKDSQDTLEDQKKKRHIKRVLRFSDGELEEYSSSEDEMDHLKQQQQVCNIDPNTLTWGPWAWYKTVKASEKVLGACDYVGEILADFLGITSPKYQFEINEYNKMQAFENEIRKREDVEMAGWYNRKDDNLAQSSMILNQNNVGTHV